MKIVLASTSPRRREILDLVRIDYQVHAPLFEELSDETRSPEHEAIHFAREKTFSLRELFPDSLIIGSDTIVALGEKNLGKPVDAEDAKFMLRYLAGRTHRVLTAIAVLEPKTARIRETLRETRVRMKPMMDADIEDYVRTGEPLDKAGAYAVQGLGGKFIDAVEGDYFNVVGLPLRDLAKILREFGVEISVDVEEIYRKSELCSSAW